MCVIRTASLRLLAVAATLAVLGTCGTSVACQPYAYTPNKTAAYYQSASYKPATPPARSGYAYSRYAAKPAYQTYRAKPYQAGAYAKPKTSYRYGY